MLTAYRTLHYRRRPWRRHFCITRRSVNPSSLHPFHSNTSSDPAFFLHHSAIDRTFTTWQNQDIAKRQYALGGTITLNNSPPSRNATLNDTIDLGYIGVPALTIKQASNTLDGPFCYIYR